MWTQLDNNVRCDSSLLTKTQIFVRYVLFHPCFVADEEDDSDDAIQESETEDETSSTKRRNRTCFLPEQLEILERSFQECRYPDSTTRDRLAKETNLSDNKIQVSRRTLHFVLPKCFIASSDSSICVYRSFCNRKSIFAPMCQKSLTFL